MTESLLQSDAVVPERWYQTPPKGLVVGDGAFASTLAMIFCAERLEPTVVEVGFPGNLEEGYAQVLGDLSRVFLVVKDGSSAVEALRLHKAAWRWVERLAPEGDQHELAFIFVLPPNASPSFEMALATGLSLPRIEPSTGHAVWRMSGSLNELVGLLRSIQPTDLLPLRARQAADVRRAALAELQRVLLTKDAPAVREAAQAVLAVFPGQEHLLDVFCREPSHQHGNQLRGWLHKVVTGEVTQEQQWIDEAKQLDTWLAVEAAG